MRAVDVLNTKWETIQEVAKEVGMHPKDVAPMVEQFVRDGHAEIGTWKVGDCSVPMVRLRPGIYPAWKKKRKK